MSLDDNQMLDNAAKEIADALKSKRIRNKGYQGDWWKLSSVNQYPTHQDISQGSELRSPVDPEQHLAVTVYLRPANNHLQHLIEDVVAGNLDTLTRQEYECEFGLPLRLLNA
ncbi:unnamed protein product [Umbelopsis vinacea]